jgi:hypothetical protein
VTPSEPSARTKATPNRLETTMKPALLSALVVTALLAKAGRGDRDGPNGAEAPPARADDPEDPPKPGPLEFRLINWHASKQVWVGVVLTQLDQPSTNAAFAKLMYDRGEDLIASMDPESYHPELVARVAGAFRNFNEIDQVNADVIAAGAISLTLVTLLLLAFVRKPLNLVLINIPLFTAMAWAMAVTFMVYQRLTLLTAFILSLILGLGIDYAVHLYARWTEEMRRGRQPIPAMSRAMTTTGRALLASAATSIIAMLSLQVGHFEGFREFGVVVSLGIFFALIASWIVTPPLFFLAVRGTAWIGRRISRAPVRWAVKRLLPSGAHGGRLLPKLNVTPRTMKILAASAAVLTAAVSFAPPVDFENDFRNSLLEVPYEYSDAVCLAIDAYGIDWVVADMGAFADEENVMFYHDVAYDVLDKFYLVNCW